jgi:hypothetical protein
MNPLAHFLVADTPHRDEVDDSARQHAIRALRGHIGLLRIIGRERSQRIADASTEETAGRAGDLPERDD